MLVHQTKSHDAITALCHAAATLLDQAHDLCDDPDTERLLTALILQAKDEADEAANIRVMELP